VLAAGTGVFIVFGCALVFGVSVGLLLSGIRTRLTVFFGSAAAGLVV
jgi:hypothetical protein